MTLTGSLMATGVGLGLGPDLPDLQPAKPTIKPANISKGSVFLDITI
jgi:hypothetical protein